MVGEELLQAFQVTCYIVESRTRPRRLSDIHYRETHRKTKHGTRVPCLSFSTAAGSQPQGSCVRVPGL